MGNYKMAVTRLIMVSELSRKKVRRWLIQLGMGTPGLWTPTQQSSLLRAGDL